MHLRYRMIESLKIKGILSNACVLSLRVLKFDGCQNAKRSEWLIKCNGPIHS